MDRLIYGPLTYALLLAAGLHYEMPSVVLCAITAAAFAGLVGAIDEYMDGHNGQKPWPSPIAVMCAALAFMTYILPAVALTILLVFLVI